MRLLALDLSTNVGHALVVRTIPSTPPRFGTLKLEGPDLAWKLGQFLVWLEDQYMVDPFDGIAWERPIITPTDKVDLLELLYGLVGVAYAFAGKHKLPWREVSVVDAKKTLTNKKNATKDEMLFAARRVANWNVSTHHEADAGAVGAFAYDLIWPARGEPAGERLAGGGEVNPWLPDVVGQEAITKAIVALIKGDTVKSAADLDAIEAANKERMAKFTNANRAAITVALEDRRDQFVEDQQ